MLYQTYDQLKDEGPKLQSWLDSQAPEIDSQLEETRVYRKLKNYCINEVGLVTHRFTHPEEVHFFSPSIPVYAVQEPADKRKQPFLLLHDLRHYTMGEFIPYGDQMEAIDFETYRQMCSWTEGHAVWFSDVLIPELFGLDNGEAIFGGISSARVFQEVGMNHKQSLEAITMMEKDGLVPENILQHPEYERYHPVILNRSLLYHELDKVKTKMVYDFWMEHPEVARTALLFKDTVFNTEEAFQKSFSHSFETMILYKEDVNPDRAYVSQILHVGLRATALNLAYLKDSCAYGEEMLTSKISRLHNAYVMLKHVVMDEGIQSAVRYAQEIEETLLPQAQELISVLSTTEKILPFVPDTSQVDYEKARELARENEQKNLRRAGVKV